MRVSIFRKARFNAAHRLHNPSLSDEENNRLFGKCNNPNYHGHNYLLEVKVTGELDPQTGYVMDAKDLKDIIQEEVHSKFDHRNLNLDTSEFKELNPTAENIAVVVWNLLRRRIPAQHDLSLVLHETENNYVEYNGN